MSTTTVSPLRQRMIDMSRCLAALAQVARSLR